MRFLAIYQGRLLRRFLKDLFLLSFSSVAILYILQASLDYPMDLPFLGLGPAVFLMNLLLILAPLVAWSFLLDARALSILSIFGSAGFAALNFRKITERGDPIELLDFYNLQVSPVLLKYMGVREILGLIAILCLPFGFRFAVNRFWRKRRPWGIPHFAYIAVAFSLVVYFTAVCAEPFRSDSYLQDLFPPHPDHADAFRRNGLPLSTILNMKFIRVFHPNNYSEDVIRKIVSLQPTVAPASIPNNSVVLILLESFRDYSLDGVPFSEDVIPFYHQLKKESVVGNYYSPVLGGGTANVEFEVLTGMSMAFLPADSIPHEQYLAHPTPAVTGWLSKYGYETYSVHDNFGSYYNRVNVFKTLKFNRFFDSKELIAEFGRYKGPGYPDRTVFEKSLRLFSASRDKPQFQYLITMNTHGPYTG
ncbi:MAG: LTA synthase family protein, partial [Bdellovibrionota bacterium]